MAKYGYNSYSLFCVGAQITFRLIDNTKNKEQSQDEFSVFEQWLKLVKKINERLNTSSLSWAVIRLLYINFVVKDRFFWSALKQLGTKLCELRAVASWGNSGYFEEGSPLLGHVKRQKF